MAKDRRKWENDMIKKIVKAIEGDDPILPHLKTGPKVFPELLERVEKMIDENGKLRTKVQEMQATIEAMQAGDGVSEGEAREGEGEAREEVRAEAREPVARGEARERAQTEEEMGAETEDEQADDEANALQDDPMPDPQALNDAPHDPPPSSLHALSHPAIADVVELDEEAARSMCDLSDQELIHRASDDVRHLNDEVRRKRAEVFEATRKTLESDIEFDDPMAKEKLAPVWEHARAKAMQSVPDSEEADELRAHIETLRKCNEETIKARKNLETAVQSAEPAVVATPVEASSSSAKKRPRSHHSF